MVSIAMSVSVTVGTSVSVVGIGLSLSLSGPLAPGHGSEGASRETVGVVVAVESGVDVVVVDSNTVAVVAAYKTVETLGRPVGVGSGDTRVDSNTTSESVAVVSISISAPLSVVGTGSIDGGLAAIADSSGPGRGDTAGSNKGIAVSSVESVSIGAPLSVDESTGSINGALVAVPNSSGPGGGDAAGADEGVAVAVEGVGVSHGGRGQAGGDQD